MNDDCAKTQSAIQGELNTLSQAVEELEVTISRHIDRIAPVRYNPPQPSCPPDGKGLSCESNLCDLGSSIRQSRKRVELAFSELRAVSEQIQL